MRTNIQKKVRSRFVYAKNRLAWTMSQSQMASVLSPDGFIDSVMTCVTQSIVAQDQKGISMRLTPVLYSRIDVVCPQA